MAMKEFSPGERLFAADLNDNFDETKLAGNITSGTFADARIPNLNASKITAGRFDRARMPAGTVLNVVQTAKTNAFTTTSTSYTDVTGLAVTITPSSATSKVLIIFAMQLGGPLDGGGHVMLTDGANNPLLRGNASQSRTRVTGGARGYASAGAIYVGGSFLWSPGAATPVTAKIRAISPAGGTVRINSDGNDANSVFVGRGASTLVAIEVAG